MKNYRRYARKANPIVKRVNIYAPAVKQLASDVMYLKGLINSEPKTHITTSSNNFSYAGTVVSLCDVPTGDTSNSRDGNRILPRFLNIKFHINRGISGTTYTHSTVRFVIFRWWGETANAAGTAPTASDVLTNTSSQYAPMGHLSQAITGNKGDRNRRIEVHRSGMFTLDSVSKTSVDEDYNITLNGGNGTKEHIEYYDPNTNPPTSGGFFILFINDNPTSSDTAYYLQSRITFYDN